MYKLLIIDDDHTIISVLTRIFTAEKYEVQHAGTIEDGFQACLKELPDLVLLDINLPDGNGIDLCCKIKENPCIRHIPVILLTGEATSIDCKVRGLECGAEDYVLKPFLADELIARVAGILKRSFH